MTASTELFTIKNYRTVGVQETVLLVNHTFARGGTPAIFVIFVVSRGLSSKTLVLLVRMQFVILTVFVKNPLFLAGQKHGLPQTPFLGPRHKALSKQLGNIFELYSNCLEKAGTIDRNRLQLALKTSHGRWGKTTPKIYDIIYAKFLPLGQFAAYFFLAEATHFAFFGGKRRKIKDTKT